MTMATATKPTYAPDELEPDFHIYTDALKAGEDDGRPTVLATASSDAIDLEADRFTRNALKQMRDGFTDRLIFLNHKYNVPDDVFGVVQKAELIKRDGRLDLDLTILVEVGNPRAVQTYQYITNGTRLGVSVGVIVTEADKSDDDEDEHGRSVVDIDGVIPLEASIVGIPANQTAWTREAVKSLFERGALDLDDGDVAARPWLAEIAQAKITAASGFEDLDIVGRGAVASHSPAKAPRDRAWQASAAVRRMRSWAGGPAKEDISWRKYRTGFAWFNGESPEKFGSYKLSHHDIVSSSFVVVFRGAAAAAVVLQGGRGGVAIPEGDVGAVKAHIARHYHQFDEKAPWEREKEDGWLDVELDVAADLLAMDVLDDELPAFEDASWPEDEEDAMPKTDDAKTDDEPVEDEPVEDETEDDPEETSDGPEDAPEDVPEEERAEKPEDSKDDEPEDELVAVETDNEPEDEPVEDEPEEKEDEPEKTDGDFDDDVDADLAADVLIDKQFSGFRILLNNLITVLLDTDLSLEERRKAGMETVTAYQEYTENTWNETIDDLGDDDKSLGGDDIDGRLHDTLAMEVECGGDDEPDADDLEEEVAALAESAYGIAEENEQLREDNEQLETVVAYTQAVLDAVMELPLPTVTSEAQTVARSLAEKFPALDNRVVERIARFAPSRPATS